MIDKKIGWLKEGEESAKKDREKEKRKMLEENQEREREREGMQ